jgi:ABC-type dipeptide/oligopeptide/nickel transport system permease component
MFARDTYVVMAAVMLSAAFLIAGNLLADILMYWNDPRIRVVSA